MQSQTHNRPTVLEASDFDPAALDRLPAADDLASAQLLTDPLDREFAAPAITNQWSGLMAGREPFAYVGWSTPDLFHESHQAETFLGVNGAPLTPTSQQFNPLEYRWYPGRITRRGSNHNLNISVSTSLATDRQAVLNELTLSNRQQEPVSLDLFIRLTSDIRAGWSTDWPPPETAVGHASHDGRTGSVSIGSPSGDAFAVAGADRAPHAVAGFARQDARWDLALGRGRLDSQLEAGQAHVVLHYRLELAAGQEQTLRWVHAMAADLESAQADWNHCQREFAQVTDRTRDAWQQEWRSAFDREAGSFSGHAPVLVSSNPKLERLYYMGIMTLLQCKRTPQFGTPARVYLTGFPSSTFTFHNNWIFPWDAMMVSGILSQLDPAVMKAMIMLWLESDLHAGCAVDFRDGTPVGFWYAVNDYALIHMVWQYTRYTGDYGFLQQQIRGLSVLDHLKAAALYYRGIAGQDGLADYGGANNLLECVSTYTHKVASFNAANVWNLRTVAHMLERAGRMAEAAELLKLAEGLVPRVQALYVQGEGVWSCLQPDGSSNVVRHCLDFHTVAQCLRADLSQEQKQEMVAFFMRELRTETWMHALSPLDPDTAFSSRTDHQDEGAYSTWPAYAFEVLMDFGFEAEAMDWLGDKDRPGFADVTWQGPFGQAYNHGDEGSFRLAGAGSKAPMEEPHIEKPVLLPGGKYAQIVLEAVAGIQPEQFGPVLLSRDSPAAHLELHNVLLRGQDHALGNRG